MNFQRRKAGQAGVGDVDHRLGLLSPPAVHRIIDTQELVLVGYLFRLAAVGKL